VPSPAGQITASAPKIVDIMTVAGASAGDRPAGCFAAMLQSRMPVSTPFHADERTKYENQID
jgi:hypothetical protein